MTHQQRQTALALLRSGRSFVEAAELSGLTVNEVFEVWQSETKEVKTPESENGYSVDWRQIIA